MSDDSFTEVTSTSWFSRIGQSIMGVLFGLLLIAGAIALLFWNEKRSVDTAKALKEGAGAVVTIDAATIVPANEGKLVHLTGQATTKQTLRDKDFGIAVPALKLKRTVEMYQWREDKSQEKQKELGGGEKTITKYTYKKNWAENLIDASGFKQPDGHANPSVMPLRSQETKAQSALVGGFTLSKSLLDELGGYERLQVQIPANLVGKALVIDNGLFLGQDPANPQIGDLKVSFEVVKPALVSIYAAQKGNSFAPYPTKIGKALERIESGARSAQEMFQGATSENSIMTWILRAVGFVVMFFGFALGFKPISVLLDVLPFLGDVAEWGLGFFAFLLALTVSITVVAIAWIVFRPLLGAGLLVAALALFFGLGRLKKPATA